ncbi:MAG: hypothetical protein HY821_10995 [Acidobacteria bacterium]|nr:hypothetical protein [Acidobacteriota bacterium]
MKKLVWICLALAGCARYADFTLPDAGAPQQGAYLWEPRPGPVIPNRAVDTLNPSIVAWKGGLLNLLSVYDGKGWHTEAATSSDGFAWTYGTRVLSPDPKTWEGSYIAANGATLLRNGELLHYYQGGDPPRIGLARSTDGATFRRQPEPVVGFGPRGSWDERGAADPYVFESGGRIYLFYLGQDRARRQRLGLAMSRDGLTWTKLRQNPIMELGGPGAIDENGLGEPAVWQAHGWWWILYTGRARNEVRRMALARSRDGIRWEKTGPVISGTEPWNSKVVCDATVIPSEDRVRVWFGGGDVALPAENLHGQIGYGELVWRPSR